jgi:molybdopterin/thiamine biosynthesis adenylyltransferase
VTADLAMSRPIATAQALGEMAPDAHRFVDKSVLLTGEADVLGTSNGRECLLAALRLLPRICPNVTVALPSECASLAEECKNIAAHVAFGPPVRFRAVNEGLNDYEAILSVGYTCRADLPWTVVNSQGWLARVSSTGENLPGDCGQWNPVGALAAASLGVSEIFKRLIRLKAHRGPLFPLTVFSLYSYTTGASDPGPALPQRLEVDLALFGVGAIGNGIVHLLRQLPLGGRIDIVDRQQFGRENLGTCFLIGPVDEGKEKAGFAESLLSGVAAAKGYKETIADYLKRLGPVPHPCVVLNALDNIDARHEAQRMWPDIVIDGAIGQFECQVSSHPWGADVACLQCLFRQPTASADAIAARATGLSPRRIHQPDAVVTERDVESAPAESREYLRSQLGRPICSVVSEAVAKRISEDALPENFRPSVPFVATMSAAMVVGELVRFIAGWPPVLEPRFQFDLLVGPASGQELGQRRRDDCICTTRAANIEKLRRRRMA